MTHAYRRDIYSYIQTHSNWSLVAELNKILYIFFSFLFKIPPLFSICEEELYSFLIFHLHGNQIPFNQLPLSSSHTFTVFLSFLCSSLFSLFLSSSSALPSTVYSIFSLFLSLYFSLFLSSSSALPSTV